MHLLDAARTHVAPIYDALSSGSIFRPELSDLQLTALFCDCVLRPMLPQRYAIKQGAVFSAEKQVETTGGLIYEASHALPLGNLLPIETVFALCDMTRTLDEAEFEQRLLAVQAFKRLKREAATAYDVSPVHHLHMFGARYAQMSDVKLNPLLGYVFAADAVAPDVLLLRLNEMLRAGTVGAEFTPDAVFSLHGGWLIARQTRAGEIAVPRSTFAKFGVYTVGDDVLTWIYVLLNATLAQIQLRSPDLMRALTVLSRKP